MSDGQVGMLKIVCKLFSFYPTSKRSTAILHSKRNGQKWKRYLWVGENTSKTHIPKVINIQNIQEFIQLKKIINQFENEQKTYREIFQVAQEVSISMIIPNKN